MGQYSEAKEVKNFSNIVITRLLEDDDNASTPDQQDDGFWPSKDTTAAGYCPPEHFEQSMETAKTRMARFEAGVWNYIGVRAKAVVHIPIGNGSMCTYTLKSAGVWGIESDSGEEYLQKVFMEQAQELLEHLRYFSGALENVDIQKE